MIAVVDYEAGNIGSVANALKRLGAEFEVTFEPDKIRLATGVIFPGQGRAGPAIASLKKAGLDQVLPQLKQPFLGICLGMQLMVEEIEEDEQIGLGIIPGRCMLLKDVSPVPHMGWNKVKITRQSPILEGLKNGSYQYFVHSYAVKTPDEFTVATTVYGSDFASVIARDNFYGVQFHPEKSGTDGEQIIKNFLKLCGANK